MPFSSLSSKITRADLKRKWSTKDKVGRRWKEVFLQMRRFLVEVLFLPKNLERNPFDRKAKPHLIPTGSL